MKHLSSLAILLAAAVAAPTMSASKYNAYSRLLMSRAGAQSRDMQPVAAFVTLSNADSAPALEAYGLELSSLAGNIAVVKGLPEALDEAASADCVQAVRLARPLVLCNDLLVRDISADKVNEAPGVEGKAYTGAGVIAGLYDTGFDFCNPTYSADGVARIQRVWRFIEDADCEEYSDPNMLELLKTDSFEEQHGSHVLGTMAGHYPGSPYDGVAPAADIAIACGPLNDADIAAGVSRIAQYARAEGKPCVINLSIADYTGPCDGSDEFCRSLEASTSASGDAILVMSAGNEAGFKRSLSKTFSDGDTALRSFVLCNLNRRTANGVISVWSGDSRPLKLTVVVMEMFDGDVLTSFEMPLDVENAYRLVTSDYNVEDADHVVSKVDTGMSQAFENSYIAVFYSDNISTNGRSNYYVDYDFSLVRATNPSGSKAFGIIVEGEPGQRVDVQLQDSSSQLYSAGRPGWTTGGDSMTVSSMGCTKGAVCVGSYNTRRDWTALNGKYTDLGDSYALGDISPWSSRGITVDGRALPHVTAPGAAIVSVKSTPYVSVCGNDDEIVYKVDRDDRTDYWGIGYGTSMSSPAVAGAIALWLEADPSLSADDVHDIIAATSRREDVMDADPVAWGAGKIDVEAGLREVLARRASLAGPSAVASSLISWRLSGESLEAAYAGADTFDAALYDIAGRCVARGRGSDGKVTLGVGVMSGVYVLRAGSDSVRIALR